jgi:hypothetical protein
MLEHRPLGCKVGFGLDKNIGRTKGRGRVLDAQVP